MSPPIDKVLATLDRTRKSGAGWTARCPAHDDRNPSLSVREGDNGAVLIKCMAGCDTAAVVAAMGLQMSDLFPPKDRTSRGNSVVQRNFTRQPGERPAAPDPPPEALPTSSLFTLTQYGKIQRKPVDWLVRGYLVRNTLAGLIAPPGTCKSFLAVDWACRVATGTPWNGREVKRGAVFYLAGEGQSGLAKRIEGWEIENKVDAKEAPLYVSSGLPFLCDPVNVTASIEIIEAVAEELFFAAGIEPALIVIDTVARAMNGANENASDDMGRFIAAKDALRTRWGCTVLSVHHTGHDAAAQKRGRGSSNYGANLDSDFYLTSKGDTVQLAAGTKSKDWTTPAPITLDRVVVTTSVIGEDGEPETTLVLRDVAGALLEQRARTQRDRAVELRRRGLSERAIADELQTSKTTVHRWLQEAA